MVVTTTLSWNRAVEASFLLSPVPHGLGAASEVLKRLNLWEEHRFEQLPQRAEGQLLLNNRTGIKKQAGPPAASSRADRTRLTAALEAHRAAITGLFGAWDLSFPPQLWWAQVHSLTAPGPTGIRPEHIPDLLSVLRRVHANKVHAAFPALCYRLSTGTFRCTFGRTRLEKCRTYLRERVATKVIPLCRCSSISPCTRLSSAPEIFSEKVENFSLFGRRVPHLQTREGWRFSV